MAFGRNRSEQQTEGEPTRSGPVPRRVTDGDAFAVVAPADRHNVSLIVDVTWERNEETIGLHDDTVLEHISWIIMATVRTTDIVYRHGHAQFCVLLPASPADAGAAVADRIREQIDRSEVLSGLGIVLSVSVDGDDTPSTDGVDRSVDRAIGALGGVASTRPQASAAVDGSGSVPSRASARTRMAVQATGAPVPPLGDLPSALLPD